MRADFTLILKRIRISIKMHIFFNIKRQYMHLIYLRIPISMS